jgi:hypothetical protein
MAAGTGFASAEVLRQAHRRRIAIVVAVYGCIAFLLFASTLWLHFGRGWSWRGGFFAAGACAVALAVVMMEVVHVFEDRILKLRRDRLRGVLDEIGKAAPFMGAPVTDPNQRGEFGATPLETAIHWENNEYVAILLDAGADANARLEKNETPLHLAARIGDAGIVQMLLDKGARRDAIDDFSRTPLDTARSRGNMDVARMLEEFAR